jgi:hypothetical protein
MTRRTWVRIAVGIAACVLSACSVAIPEPSTSPSLDGRGAVLDAQAERIARQTFDEIDAADTAADAALLDERVSEGAALVRGVEYAVEAAGGSAPEVIVGDVQAFYTTDSDSWPRPLIGVTVPADPDDTPVVLVWSQGDAQGLYELSSWASMIPGAVLPAMPSLSTGASLLALDASGLTMTPGEAIEQYVALLNDGGDDLDQAFAPDPYREGMFQARSSLSSSAKGRGGTYTDTIEANLDESFALADAEGGALVFVQLAVTSDFNVPGAQLTLLASADKALLEGTLKSRVVYRYEDVVIVRLWPEGAETPPTVVAVGQHLVGVATS